MSEFAEQIVKRLDEMRLTTSERREAIVSLQRAEQIVDFLIEAARFGRRLIEYASHAIVLAARLLRVRYGNSRRRPGRTHRRRPGTT